MSGVQPHKAIMPELKYTNITALSGYDNPPQVVIDFKSLEDVQDFYSKLVWLVGYAKDPHGANILAEYVMNAED